MPSTFIHCFKQHLIALLAASSLATSALAQSDAPAPSLGGELRPIIQRVQAKAQKGAPTEKDLEPELRDLDALLARQPGGKGDDNAQILLVKARIYSEVLHDQKAYAAIAAQIRKDYPDSKPAVALKRQEQSEKIRDQLVPGAVFPDFQHKDTAGVARSVSAFKGKVLLVDFWATWCGPCVRELPNVQRAYEKYHARGFEVLAVSFDREPEKLQAYVEEHKLPWPQILDGEDHPLGAQYGVVAIPTTFLIDREGKLAARNVRGEALDAAIAKALAQ
jgi:peroxiredoxin